MIVVLAAENVLIVNIFWQWTNFLLKKVSLLNYDFAFVNCLRNKRHCQSNVIKHHPKTMLKLGQAALEYADKANVEIKSALRISWLSTTFALCLHGSFYVFLCFIWYIYIFLTQYSTTMEYTEPLISHARRTAV